MAALAISGHAPLASQRCEPAAGSLPISRACRVARGMHAQGLEVCHDHDGPRSLSTQLKSRMLPADALFWYIEEATLELRPLVGAVMILGRRPDHDRLHVSRGCRADCQPRDHKPGAVRRRLRSKQRASLRRDADSATLLAAVATTSTAAVTTFTTIARQRSVPPVGSERGKAPKRHERKTQSHQHRQSLHRSPLDVTSIAAPTCEQSRWLTALALL